MKDKVSTPTRSFSTHRRGDDNLGANSDIGSKLRALYGAVQEEPIPNGLLDLLEKLDEAEQKSRNDSDRS